jgi:GWxTD domain-containing protein
LLFLVIVQVCTLVTLDSASQRRKEGETDYFKRWLERDVVYIITDEEKEVFQKLTRPEEKEAFIEQFWKRRNPDPSSPVNEFKEEYYRRIVYANEHFAAGVEGWATDRGRTYIMFGPPKSVDRNPTGGVYVRSGAEGGGETMTYPYETWTYDYIEGIGSGIKLEFVDPSFTGEYRLARDPYEKDALLDKPSGGLTLAEEQGKVSKRARLDASFMGRGSYAQGNTWADMNRQPFEDLQRYFALRRPPELKFKDLQAVITSQITYRSADNSNVGFSYQYFYLDDGHCLVPICFAIRLADLTPKTNDSGNRFVKIDIYSKVTDISQRVQYEFEDSMSQNVDDGNKNSLCLYEKKLPLKPGRYKLTTILKDENSSRLTVLEESLHVPEIAAANLALSSIDILSGFRKLESDLSLTEPFVMPGGVKAYPYFRGMFSRNELQSLGIHFEVYHCAFAKDTGLPQIGASFKLYNKNGDLLLSEQLPRASLRLVDTRVVALHKIDLTKLPPGSYQLQATAYDAVRNQEVVQSVKFSITDPAS